MVTRNKKNAANQHDKRHENGLAAPGKRITKQKSNPQLDAHVNGSITTSTTTTTTHPPNPPSSVHVNSHHQYMTQHHHHTHLLHQQQQQQPSFAALDNDDNNHDNNGYAHAPSAYLDISTAAATTPPGAATPRRLTDGRARTVSDLSLDHLAACHQYHHANGSLDSAPPDTPRRLDTHASKSAAAYRTSTANTLLTVATTILSSCPLRDVLAILIILLQLPPAVLTVVQFLFATLTFVPPQAGTPLSALSAIPSFTDIFQGSGGTPSLFTIVFADSLILLIWLVLWVPVQNFFLDLAQAVIAIALGGAAAGRNGTTNGIFICFIIILSNHLFRFRPLREHIVHFLWTGLARGGLDFLASPPITPSFQESFSTPHGWPRSLLGIHILAQGVVRIIRRSLSRREAAAQALPTGKKTDPEVGGHLPRAPTVNFDPAPEPPNSSSTDGRPPGPSPASQTRDKTSSSRRKRKQATHVRSQQPFWAALASTKVTVMKEMESSRAANDADEASAKDPNHLGDAAGRPQEDCVWISGVGHADVSFRVNLCDDSEPAKAGEGQNGTVGSGIDKSKPFYIRVNGADWSSTRIRQATSLGYIDEGTGGWVGEIFGLTALSNYEVQFVRTVDDEVFFTTSLITSAGPIADQASISSPPPHQTLRPSSPTTTLKNSIAAADQKLQDHRNRLKRNRKDHKAAITALKKEVETLANRLANAGGSDERQRQRVLQFNQNIRQAEDAAADFSLQVDSLGEVPSEEAAEAAVVKRAWKKERDQNRTVLAEFDKVKNDIEREVSSVDSDISSALQKRERLQQRQTRLNEQHDRLVTANREGFSAQQRRQQERIALLQERLNIENQYRSNINGFERRAAEINVSTAQGLQTIQHYEALLLQAAQQQPSVPTTPEGPLPGTSNGMTMSPFASAFTFPSLTAHVNGTPGSLRGGRGRSSSMLSNVSGFTDGFDDHISPSHPMLNNLYYGPGLLSGRKGSNGSGSLSSGTSSQSSSQRDPMSPVPNVKPISTAAAARTPANGSAGLAGAVGGR